MDTKALKRTALALLALIALLATAVAPGLADQLLLPQPDGAQSQAEAGTEEAAPTSQPQAGLRSARIRAVGDLMVHQTQLNHARREDGSYDFHPQYARIADVLEFGRCEPWQTTEAE